MENTFHKLLVTDFWIFIREHLISSAINIEESVEDFKCFGSNKIHVHKDCGILETSEVSEFIKFHGDIRNHCKDTPKGSKTK